ncbi:hypothetical protein M2140_000050 [Clostridiales Family XIII bacterium PM5-7]
MYNEKLKRKYLEHISYMSDELVHDMTVVFEKIEPYEEEAKTDICNINPHEYLDIIFEAVNPKKLTYARILYKKLLHYRDYCYREHQIDPIIFFGSVDVFSDTITMDDIFDKFAKYQKKKNNGDILLSPDELFSFLTKNLYAFDSVPYRKAMEDDDGKMRDYQVITLDEMVLLYIMLIYFGVDKNKCSMILRKNVHFNEPESLMVTIYLEDKKYEIEGDTFYLIKKVIGARIIEKGTNNAVSEKWANIDYMLAFDEDETEAQVKRRSRKFYNKFARDKIDSGYGDAMTLSLIEFHGTIHRMCKISKKHDIICENKNDTAKLYQTITGSEIKSVYKSLEVYRQYERHMKAMNDKEEPKYPSNEEPVETPEKEEDFHINVDLDEFEKILLGDHKE